MPKKQPQPVQVPEVSTETGLTPPASQPISFEEPAAQLADGAAISDTKPADFVDPAPLSRDDMDTLVRHAEKDNRKYDFYKKVIEARTPAPEPQAPSPVAPRIIEQTNAELEAGRACVAKHEKLAASRGPVAPLATDGRSDAVFRPGDYVPDPRKGQGMLTARTL